MCITELFSSIGSTSLVVELTHHNTSITTKKLCNNSIDIKFRLQINKIILTSSKTVILFSFPSITKEDYKDIVSVRIKCRNLD